jgi:hypothetical protein
LILLAAKWTELAELNDFIQPSGGGGKDVFVHISAEVAPLSPEQLSDSIRSQVQSRISYRAAKRSVLVSKHNGDDPLGDCRVGRVRRMSGKGFVVTIDLEKDRDAIDIERAEVVLFVWVVGFAEIIEDRDGLHNPIQDFLAEGGHAWGNDDTATEEVLA